MPRKYNLTNKNDLFRGTYYVPTIAGGTFKNITSDICNHIHWEILSYPNMQSKQGSERVGILSEVLELSQSEARI